jgi:hypothetical protein
MMRLPFLDGFLQFGCTPRVSRRTSDRTYRKLRSRHISLFRNSQGEDFATEKSFSSVLPRTSQGKLKFPLLLNIENRIDVLCKEPPVPVMGSYWEDSLK